MLEVINLSKSYNEKKALDNINTFQFFCRVHLVN